mgnify:CR=1 FL=1
MEERIKAKDLPNIKKILIARQNGRCPLCENDLRRIKPINVVVDHCHETGRIRAALCRGCNGAEGKIKNLAIKFGKTKDYVLFCQRLIKYWLYHRLNKSEWIHHTYKTQAEDRESRNKKARTAYAKKKDELARRQASLLKRRAK